MGTSHPASYILHTITRLFGFFTAFTFVTFITFATFFPAIVLAGTSDTWRGAAWSSTAGWLMMNCVSDPTQTPPCQPNYGVNIATALNAKGRYDVSGWVWSANVGWICFGATCNGLVGATPEGGVPYAEVESAPANVLHGWADIISLGASGWLSLNCADLSFGCTTYKVTADRATGAVAGFGWNGNQDQSGIGWVDFSPSTVLLTELNCVDGVDNDSDGAVDCADRDCQGKPGPACGVPYVCGAETHDTCLYQCDADGNLQKGCADPACKAFPDICPSKETLCSAGNAAVCCSNGVDDDSDGFKDCADSDCYGVGSCPADEAFLAGCQPADADGGGVPGVGGCCANVKDDDLKNNYDCADPSCAAVCSGVCAGNNTLKCIYDWQCPKINNVQKCNPVYHPWLESLLSDIYSQGKIEASFVPPKIPAQKYNATFCLLSAIGQVTKFVADPSGLCQNPQTPTSFNVPSAGSGYTSTLGRIDLTGILAGRYGAVTAVSALPGGSYSLLGRVLVVGGDLTVTNPVTFMSAAGEETGAGLVVVRGDLYLKADTGYEAQTAGLSRTKNLSSVAWLVLKNGATGGNVYVDGNVQKVAGAIFAEGRFDSGSSALPLTVYGPVVAKAFNFGRTYLDPARGSEQVIYDARTALNPPAGIVDFAKGLPAYNLSAP